MPHDWATTIANLRVKAASEGVTPQEASALIEKANELQEKYNPVQRFEWIEGHPDTITVIPIGGDNWLFELDETEDWQSGHYQFPGEIGNEYG